MDHGVVQKWLRSVLGAYTDPDRVFADVDRALIAVSSLSPKTEVFTFNDGRTQLLISLDGTIPVEFRNTTYNIPVAYWIPRDYPREPPMAFVAPTPDMAIRKGPNVDPSGEIGGDYLSRWRSKPEACNLLDLIHDCQHMFGREPPVYAKPKPTPVYATTASSSRFSANQQLRSHPPTPQRQASTSSNFAAQRPGPHPPQSASPKSPHLAAAPSFHSAAMHDPHQKPPPPAPGTPASSQDAFAPHRPPKPSCSLGAEAVYAPRSRPHSFAASADQHGWSQPAAELHSPHHSGTARFAADQTYRRSSGVGLAPTGLDDPSHHGAPSPAEHAPQSPQSLSQRAPWQYSSADRLQGVQLAHHGSQPYLPHHPQETQQRQQHQQRSHTYPHTSLESHPGPQSLYNDSKAPAPQHMQPNGTVIQPAYVSGTPQSQSQSQPPPLPGAHPYQPRPSPAAGGVCDSANGYHGSAQVAVAPKSKGVNLLDDEEDAAGADAGTTGAERLMSNTSGVAPPPRPINPELLALHDHVFSKIDSRLNALASTLGASNARLEVLSSDLDRGLPAIQDEMSRLKAVRDVCKTTGDRLDASVAEITESLRTLNAREEPDADSMVLATSIVGNQLVDLVAEDNAIEDTLYHLGRALNAERLDLERFLKQTRLLAREQFMKRALAMKISEAMGWAY